MKQVGFITKRKNPGKHWHVRDIERQQWLYRELHECCEGYGLNKARAKLLEQHPACKHPEKLHLMLKFLSHATHTVEEGVGWWSTWEDPDPLLAPAKERATYVTAKIEIDQDQFSKRQFSELHLQSRVERERSRERWVDSGSDSIDTVYNRRRKVMLRRVERTKAGCKDYDHEPHSIKEEVD